MKHKTIPVSDLIFGNDCPYIAFTWESGHIFISNAVFRLIRNPDGIRLHWNIAKQTLLIEPTDISDPDGFPVIGQSYVKNGSLQIGSVTLTHDIWTIVGWNTAFRYRIVAKYNEKSNVAIFEMKDAIASEIPRNRHGGRIKRTSFEIDNPIYDC